MNISRTDINNIDHAGEYPFRDGTITVSFAEIAVRKLEPDAQFQLMRKNPIQRRICYVLGKKNLCRNDLRRPNCPGVSDEQT